MSFKKHPCSTTLPLLVETAHSDVSEHHFFPMVPEQIFGTWQATKRTLFNFYLMLQFSVSSGGNLPC